MTGLSPPYPSKLWHHPGLVAHEDIVLHAFLNFK